jgi:pimeloyl-ACP methyl ester carboxylesterase
MAEFVLVHGTDRDGWIWRDVACALTAMGHGTHVPDLGGFTPDDAATDCADLERCIRSVAGHMENRDLRDAVLVGHSFYGMVCGAVMMGMAHRVRRAMFVDAIIPESNRSFMQTAGEEFRHMLDAQRVDGLRVRPWPLELGGPSAHRAAWFKPRLTDIPESAFRTPFPGEFSPNLVDTAYVTCRESSGASVASPLIRAMISRAQAYGWPVTRLNAGGCPMSGPPTRLATMLASAIAATPTPRVPGTLAAPVVAGAGHGSAGPPAGH